MNSNPLYTLFASPRSVAPAILRWTLAVVLLLQIARTVLLPIYSQAHDPNSQSFFDHILPLLTSPLAIAQIVLIAGLLLGFFTRIFALLAIALAIFTYQAQGTMSYTYLPIEYLVAICGTGLALVILGGGRGSMDRLISNHLLPRVG